MTEEKEEAEQQKLRDQRLGKGMGIHQENKFSPHAEILRNFMEG